MLSKRTTRYAATRTVYAGLTEKITLLKRGDDQQEGTVRALALYRCRHSKIHKTGEPLQGDMSSNHSTLWHIPRAELDRVGVAYINAADRIVDGLNRYWQPESTTPIVVQLFENELDVHCLRVDPPSGN